MGRRLSERSPVNWAASEKPAAAPMSSRTPVPELPQSTGITGERQRVPVTCQAQGAMRSAVARARQAVQDVSLALPEGHLGALIGPMAPDIAAAVSRRSGGDEIAKAHEDAHMANR